VSPDLEDCSAHDIAGCLRDIPRITKAFERATGQRDMFVVLQNGRDAGQQTPHLNVQVVPCPARKKTIELRLIGNVSLSDNMLDELAEGLRTVSKQDQVGRALNKPSQPLESSWQRPILKPTVNPVGTSSPFVTRARAPHPPLEKWETQGTMPAPRGSRDSVVCVCV
jgi:diadenosine tetraphosphate (Ap4A) HIT family hydrolase